MHLLKYDYDVENNSLLFFKQKQMFKKLIVKKHDEISKLSNKINCDDLMYHYKGNNIDKKMFK